VTPKHQEFADCLKQKIAAAGLEDRVTFVGEAPATAPWYEALDVYVAPQRWEGFGVTPLEAGAYGLPVVATTVGAFPDIISEGMTGTLVPPGDVAAMIAAIRPLLADSELRLRFGAAARDRVTREFSLAREAAAIDDVYRQLWDA
jgi:mannosyltransferase